MNPSGGGAGGHEPIASATTGTVKNISQTGATLSGSYSLTEGKVSELGIQYGTSSTSLDKSVSYAGLPDYLESLIESETPSWTEFQNF